MERSRNGLAGLGIFILTVGLIWILVSVGVITWSIVDALFVLWPLLLVIIGVNIIFRKNAVIKGLAWLVFLAVLISYSYIYEDKGGSSKNLSAGANVTVEKYAGIQTADLSLKLGGTRVTLDSDAKDLLDASLSDKDIQHSADYNSDHTKASILFEKKRYTLNNIHFSNGENNIIHLSPAAVWNIDIDTGAADSTLDLSGLKTGRLDVDMGAANLKIKLGSCNTAVKVNAGVSKIDITTPSDTGVRVRFTGGLNSSNLNDAGWSHEGGYYYSPGYEQKAYKIDADITMGVGKLTVNGL